MKLWLKYNLHLNRQFPKKTNQMKLVLFIDSCNFSFWETDIRTVRRSNQSTIRRKYGSETVGSRSTTYVLRRKKKKTLGKFCTANILWSFFNVANLSEMIRSGGTTEKKCLLLSINIKSCSLCIESVFIKFLLKLRFNLLSVTIITAIKSFSVLTLVLLYFSLAFSCSLNI